MKKVLDGFILIVLCIFLFTGCYEQVEETINFEEIANASKIELTHYISGTATTETIENTDDINNIANWLNELMLEEVSFPENKTPTDVEGGESYSFAIQEPEGNNINFNYIINDSEDCYILYNTKWYAVNNPVSITFSHNI